MPCVALMRSHITQVRLIRMMPRDPPTDSSFYVVVAAPPNYKSFAPNGSVTIGVGRRWNEVYDFLAKFNVTVAGARVTNVGVGGYTLGGGP